VTGYSHGGPDVVRGAGLSVRQRLNPGDPDPALNLASCEVRIEWSGRRGLSSQVPNTSLNSVIGSRNQSSSE